jgi:hypothetical protein
MAIKHQIRTLMARDEVKAEADARAEASRGQLPAEQVE